MSYLTKQYHVLYITMYLHRTTDGSPRAKIQGLFTFKLPIPTWWVVASKTEVTFLLSFSFCVFLPSQFIKLCHFQHQQTAETATDLKTLAPIPPSISSNSSSAIHN